MGSRGLAAAVTLRAGAIGALVFAALALMVWRHWYATGAVLIGAAAVVGLDIVRSARAIDRTLAQFVDAIMAEGYDRPAARAPGGHLVAAIERALQSLGRTRAERMRRIEFLQALIDTVPAQVLVVGDAGRVEFANRAARQRLGEAPTLDAIEALGAAAKTVLGAAAGARYVVTLAGGERMLVSIGVFVADGRRRRLIALQGLSSDLAAVELESWRGLTRILSHEMMNSLTPICSLAEALPALAAAEPGGPAIGEALEVIARRSMGLMSFVDRYRRIAELPAPDEAAVAADALVRRLHRLMSPLMAERGVDFEALAEPSELVFTADAELLEQALINLLKNALEATQGGEDARVRLVCTAEDGAVVLAVTDNGPGLGAAAEAAFTPFFTTKPAGAGIGLSLARQIALAHGGRLEHRPLRPRGAAFRIVLPLP